MHRKAKWKESYIDKLIASILSSLSVTNNRAACSSFYLATVRFFLNRWEEKMAYKYKQHYFLNFLELSLKHTPRGPRGPKVLLQALKWAPLPPIFCSPLLSWSTQGSLIPLLASLPLAFPESQSIRDAPPSATATRPQLPWCLGSLTKTHSVCKEGVTQPLMGKENKA